ncbi:DUF433 domain-containing protein [Scytonema sp. NUACC26]|uniref:DUF433 domain-containing protein n=1 Tax=Scytonema sp. NUACC26 TaxID=3140176 RepID=UPI0038B388B8
MEVVRQTPPKICRYQKDHPIPFVTDAHGIIRVGKTHVTLATVVTAFLEGATAEEVVEQYPSLQLSDVYSVIGYYLRHRSEVDKYLVERQNRATEVRQETEKRFNPVGIRERFHARRNQQR